MYGYGTFFKHLASTTNAIGAFCLIYLDTWYNALVVFALAVVFSALAAFIEKEALWPLLALEAIILVAWGAVSYIEGGLISIISRWFLWVPVGILFITAISLVVLRYKKSQKAKTGQRAKIFTVVSALFTLATLITGVVVWASGTLSGTMWILLLVFMGVGIFFNLLVAWVLAKDKNKVLSWFSLGFEVLALVAVWLLFLGFHGTMAVFVIAKLLDLAAEAILASKLFNFKVSFEAEEVEIPAT